MKNVEVKIPKDIFNVVLDSLYEQKEDFSSRYKLEIGEYIRHDGKNSIIDWKKISADCELSEEFMEKYKNLINWDIISHRQKFSENFLEKFRDKINFNMLIYNPRFKKTKSFITKYRLLGYINTEFLNYFLSIENNGIELEKAYREKKITYKLDRESSESIDDNDIDSRRYEEIIVTVISED